VRFDGVRFKVFDRDNTPALRSNRFLCLAEDRDGVLWAGTDGGGLVRYRVGIFQSFTTADGLPHDRVREVRSESDGALLVHTEAGFVTWRDGQARRVDDPSWAHQSDALQTPEGTHWRWADNAARRLLQTHYPMRLAGSRTDASLISRARTFTRSV
jgi:ligand-binding sensor domain-containing protein